MTFLYLGICFLNLVLILYVTSIVYFTLYFLWPVRLGFCSRILDCVAFLHIRLVSSSVPVCWCLLRDSGYVLCGCYPLYICVIFVCYLFVICCEIVFVKCVVFSCSYVVLFLRVACLCVFFLLLLRNPFFIFTSTVVIFLYFYSN